MSATRKLLLITAIAMIGVLVQSAAPVQARGMKGVQPVHHHEGKATSHDGSYSKQSTGGARTKSHAHKNPSSSPTTLDSVIQGSRIRF